MFASANLLNSLASKGGKSQDLFAKISQLKHPPKRKSRPNRSQPSARKETKPKNATASMQSTNEAITKQVRQVLSEIIDKIAQKPASHVAAHEETGSLIPTASGAFVAPDGKSFADKRSLRKYIFATYYTFSGLSDEKVSKEPGSINGQPFEVKQLGRCEVRLMCWSSQTQVDSSRDCRIFLGPCETSVFVRDCHDCVFTVACKQLRLRDCTRCTFHLFSETDPIIETSRDLTFAPFNGAYKELPAQFKSAGLNPEDNHWRQIFDFNPLEDGTLNYRLDESNAQVWNLSGKQEEAEFNPVPWDAAAVTVSDGGSRLPVELPKPREVQVFSWARAQDLEVGTVVRVNFNRDSKRPLSSDFYQGKVVGVNTDGTYAILYDDGDEEDKCLLKHIKCKETKEQHGIKEDTPARQEQEKAEIVPNKVEHSTQQEFASEAPGSVDHSEDSDTAEEEEKLETEEEVFVKEAVVSVEQTAKKLIRERHKEAKGEQKTLRKLRAELQRLKERGAAEKQQLSEDEQRLSTLLQSLHSNQLNGGRSVSSQIQRLRNRIAKQQEANVATRAQRRRMVAHFQDMLQSLAPHREQKPICRKDSRILKTVKHLMNDLSQSYVSIRAGKVVEIPTIMESTKVEWERYVAKHPMQLLHFASRAQDEEQWRFVGEMLCSLAACNPELEQDFFKLWFDWSKSSGKRFKHVIAHKSIAHSLSLKPGEVIKDLRYNRDVVSKCNAKATTARNSNCMTSLHNESAKNRLYQSLCHEEWKGLESVLVVEASQRQRCQAQALSTLRRYAAEDRLSKQQEIKHMRQHRASRAQASFKLWKASKEVTAGETETPEKPVVEEDSETSAIREKAFDNWEQKVVLKEEAAKLLNNIDPSPLCLGLCCSPDLPQLLRDFPIGSISSWLLVGSALKMISSRLLKQWLSWTARCFTDATVLPPLPFRINLYKKDNGQVYFLPASAPKGWSKHFPSGTSVLLCAQTPNKETPNVPLTRICKPDTLSKASIAVVDPGQFCGEDQVFCSGRFHFQVSNIRPTTCTVYVLPDIVHYLFPLLQEASGSTNEAINALCTREWQRLQVPFVRWLPRSSSCIEEATLLREAQGIERYIRAVRNLALPIAFKPLWRLAKRNAALTTHDVIFGCRPLLRNSSAELIPIPVRLLSRAGLKQTTPYVHIGDRLYLPKPPPQHVHQWNKVQGFDVLERSVILRACSVPPPAETPGLQATENSTPYNPRATTSTAKLPINALAGAFVLSESGMFFQLPSADALHSFAKHLLHHLHPKL